MHTSAQTKTASIVHIHFIPLHTTIPSLPSTSQFMFSRPPEKSKMHVLDTVYRPCAVAQDTRLNSLVPKSSIPGQSFPAVGLEPDCIDSSDGGICSWRRCPVNTASKHRYISQPILVRLLSALAVADSRIVATDFPVERDFGSLCQVSQNSRS